MDSFEFNKIAMSVLGIAFIVMSMTFLSDSIFHSEKPEQQGYAVEVTDSGGDAGEEEEAGPAYDPVNALLASADVAAGEKVFKKCAACHTNEDGGGNKVGPALYGVVERPVASAGGFSYSAALKAFAEGKSWSYEDLNGFLWKPKTFVKGTSMGFGGLKKTADRANLIAYLRTLSASPAPLPSEEAATSTEESDSTAGTPSDEESDSSTSTQ
ncbi:MAG: c-type cytochrome [Rhizobiaceae bacterium]